MTHVKSQIAVLHKDIKAKRTKRHKMILKQHLSLSKGCAKTTNEQVMPFVYTLHDVTPHSTARQKQFLFISVH